MPEFDPKVNGHRIKAQPPPPPRRGSGVLLLTLVSALTGLNMMIGAGIGAIVGGVTRAGQVTAALAAIGAGLGGAIGVALGVRVAQRVGGSSGRSSARWLTGWGIAGLIGSIALAATVTSPILPIIAILLPGLLALLGDRFAVKREMARTGQRPEKVKLRDQEASE